MSHWSLSLSTLEWIAVVAIATITSYVSVLISSPAYRGGPSSIPQPNRFNGLSFVTVFLSRTMLAFLIFLPVLVLCYCFWPTFREDFNYRLITNTESRNVIVYGLLLGFLSQIVFGRAYALGLDVEATRHISAVILILAPIIYKCMSSSQTKKVNTQMIIGIVLLGIAGALIIDDDVRNP